MDSAVIKMHIHAFTLQFLKEESAGEDNCGKGAEADRGRQVPNESNKVQMLIKCFGRVSGGCLWSVK